MSGNEGGKFMGGQVCLFSINSEIALTSPPSHTVMHVQRPAGRGGRAGTPGPKITAETLGAGSYSSAVSGTALWGCMRL